MVNHRMFAAFVLTCWLATPAGAVTPESPEVQKLVNKGVEYLEASPSHGRLGGKALVGLALLKAGKEPTHPKIAEAAEACVNGAKAEPEKINHDIYSTGLSIIFLCTLDSYKYREQIEKYLQSLELRQKPHGGWGYPERETGDTSMTQYGVLSGWEAAQAGIPMPQAVVEKVANWLLRTQDPNGGWGYQGTDPGNFTLVPQSQVRHSMVAAGLGSTVICADLLGMIKLQVKSDDGLPPALQLVVEKDAKVEADKPAVDPQLIKRATERGDRWLLANYQIDAPGWTYYYLYALERAMSFQELARGKPQKSPRWYNDAYQYLSEKQAEDGSWSTGEDAIADTAFAVLFLLRSTQKSIEHHRSLGEGTLVGGRGLPRNLVDVQLRRGRIVDSKLSGAEDLLQVLADPTHPDFDYLVDNPSALALPADPEQRANQSARLERLAQGGSPEARRVAVRALGRTDDLEVVPTLIYALSDGDWRVAREARDGLRFISRKFEGFGMPERPDPQAQRDAIQKWKSWYLTIRPDAQFKD